MKNNSKISSKMSFLEKELKKDMFYEMLRNGSTQKEAAKKVFISEKTACIWAKKWKKSSNLFLESVENIALRLKDITSQKDFSITDVRNLTQALKELEQSKFVGKSKL